MQAPSPVGVGRRSMAWPLALCWLVLVLHASLYPFSGWRFQGVAPWAYLWAPWSPYWTWWDVTLNVWAYLPLGFLLTVAGARSGRPKSGLCLGLLGPWVLSAVLEGLQTYLPQRVPSRLDLCLNGLGAVAGVGLAWAVLRWRGITPWNHFCATWLAAAPPMSYVVLLLWPFALCYPTPVPYGLGQVWPVVLGFWNDWVADTPFAVWSPVAFEPAPLGLGAWMVVVWAGVLSPLWLGGVLWPSGRQRGWWWWWCGVVAAPLVAVASTGLTYGWHRVGDAWSLAQTVSMVLAWVVALMTLHCSPRTLAWGWCVVSALGVGLLNRAGADSPYFDMALSAWSHGPFTRIHGLSQGLGWLWPYAALAVVGRALVPPYNVRK